MPAEGRPPESLMSAKGQHTNSLIQQDIFISPYSFSHILRRYHKIFIPKKVKLLIRFFEPFWISRVFHFFLRTFGKVEHHPGPLVASDKTNTQSKIDISGSNETMQNALASIVQVWRIFEIFFMFQEFRKFELLYFSSDLGEI